MRFFWRLSAVAGLLVAGALGAAAQEGPEGWAPEGPIRLMIAFAAGGGADTQARLIAEDIEARTGWSVVPEQVTGQSGVTLVREIQSAPGDGTTIGMIVTETLGYNLLVSGSGLTLDDVTPLATTARFQMGIVSLSDRGWTTFGDVIDAARSGETIRFGVMSDRIADVATLLARANGVTFNIVPLRGGAAVLDGIRAGDLDVGFAAGAQARDVANGTMVNLAHALPVPLIQSPDAPAMTDYGIDFDIDGYFMLIGPAGMDPAATQALSALIRDIAETPDSQTRGFLDRALGGPGVMVGAELDAYLQEQAESAEALLAAVEAP